VTSKCCPNTDHITNWNTEEYKTMMGERLLDWGTWIKDIAFFKRIRNVKVLNPIDHVYIEDKVRKSAKLVKKLWDATDAVHMIREGYMLLAMFLTDLAEETVAAGDSHINKEDSDSGRTGRNADTGTGHSSGRASVNRGRLSWVSADDAVARRNLGTASDSRGGGSWGAKRGGQHWRAMRSRGGKFYRGQRGFRGGRGRPY
jgi:hypothetical protein